MRTIVLIASVLTAAGTADKAVQPVAVGGVIVEDATIEANAVEPIVVRVRNQSKRTVVAWGVDARLLDSSGAVKEVAGGKDGYEWEVRVLPNNPVLRPNDSQTIRLSMPTNFAAISVTATPAYAIFDDNSAIGDERSIDLWFQYRARQAIAWQFIENAIADALTSATTPDGILRLVDAEIAAAPGEIHESLACREVAQRIRAALRPGTNDLARSLVQALRVEAGARRKAAASRSIRRQ